MKTIHHMFCTLDSHYR